MMPSCDVHSVTAETTVDKFKFSQPNPFDRTPDAEMDYIFARSYIDPQDNATTSFTPPLFVETTIPSVYTANYASISTSFLSKDEIVENWSDCPIIIKNSNATASTDTPFLDVVGEIHYPNFIGRIKRGSVIDPFGLNTSMIKYLATYSHIMDREVAYVRLVAYNQQGQRCHASHPDFGNRILLIPRRANDVIFPSQLRFHALHTVDPCHFPDEAHNRIRAAAWSHMTELERVWWDAGRCGICDTDL